jgi:hypothetical protein
LLATLVSQDPVPIPAPPITPGPLDADVIHVAPTGNANLDADAIQAAIDKLSYSTAVMRQGRVTLSGKYWLNKPLRIGKWAESGNSGIRTVDIEGLSQTDLCYMGQLTDQPIITVDGGGRGRTARLSNLFIDCGFKCRGPLLRRQCYTVCLRDCYILYARQVGLDLCQCWGSVLDSVHVVDSHGILYRSTSGSMSVRDCRFQGKGLWFGDGRDNAKNVEINRYEMANGVAATKAKYGTDYSEDWPPEDDAVVMLSNYNGACLRTRDDQRAACVIGSGPQLWTNPIWESCYYGARPLMYSQGPQLLIQNTRMEGNYSNVKWILEGNGITLGKNCRFDGVHMADPAVYADCLLELRGKTSATTVSNVTATYLGKAVVLTKGGPHVDVTVQHVATWGTYAPKYKMVLEAADIAPPITQRPPVRVPPPSRVLPGGVPLTAGPR